MEEYLYRYISFEAFVGMIQKKSLTFVLPEMWDDPKEGTPFKCLISAMKHGYKQTILQIMYNKTYAQCWTKLSESDAMWRIYSFNNRAIQIKALEDKLRALSEVQLVPVEYTDQFEFNTAKLANPSTIDGEFLRSLAMKRCAFEHEKEVRLIKPYPFQDDDDIKRHYDAFQAINNIFKVKDGRGVKVLESMYPGQSVNDRAKSVAQLLNLGNVKQKTIEISFDTLPSFIAGVKVHPLAPGWYVDTVREYCKRNDVPFDGQSTLYSKD